MFENIYQNKNILITGNTGFKGTWLTVWLLSMGAKVFGVSNAVPEEPSMFAELELEKRITYIEEDIRNLPRLKEIFMAVKPDFVFHLAAQAIVSLSYQDPVDTFSTNVMGTANVLEALRFLDTACTTVIITSDKCYENVEWTWGYRENDRVGGKDPYSASKGAAELVFHSFYHSFFQKQDKIKLASVRAGNVIGGGDWAANRIVPDCIRAWAANRPVDIRSPQATRPWQHVLEPLSGYLRVGQVLHQQQNYSGQSYNFGPNSDQSFTVLQLLEEISKNWNFRDQTEKFSIKQTSGFHEAGLLKLNCDKALHELQWKPTLDFTDTARFTATWYEKYYHTGKNVIWEYTQEQITNYYSLAKVKNLLWTQ